MIKNNQPKDLCIYISFDKTANGVIFPSYLSADNEVTIVLQHQFWDLSIDDNGFSITLDFSDEKHLIYITFKSILLFSSPNQNFALSFKNIFVDNDDNTSVNDDNNNNNDDEEDNLIYVNL